MPQDVWGSVAMSANGSVIKASVASFHGNTIWSSFNRGSTWSSNSAPVAGPLACSADGSRWVMAGRNTQIYTSTNSGVSWLSNTIPNWTLIAVASSADGRKLVTAGINSANSYSGSIYTSTNGGVTWQSNNAPSRNWTSVASSADGSKLVAVATYTAYGPSAICVSSNGGADWWLASAPANWWRCVVTSADGSQMFAAPHYGLTPQVITRLYASTNSGFAWLPSSSAAGYWDCIATSADGSKLAAAIGAGTDAGIYTWQARPALRVVLAATNLLVSWSSTAAAADFALQTNANWPLPNWGDAIVPISDDGTNRSVIFARPGNHLFFRLKK